MEELERGNGRAREANLSSRRKFPSREREKREKNERREKNLSLPLRTHARVRERGEGEEKREEKEIEERILRLKSTLLSVDRPDTYPVLDYSILSL